MVQNFEDQEEWQLQQLCNIFLNAIKYDNRILPNYKW